MPCGAAEIANILLGIGGGIGTFEDQVMIRRAVLRMRGECTWRIGGGKIVFCRAVAIILDNLSARDAWAGFKDKDG